MDALYYTLFAWFAPALYVFPIIFASGFDFRLFWRLVCWFRKVKLFRYAELASFYQFLTLWPNLLIWLSWLTLINCGETQIFCFILLSETLFRRFAHLLFKHPPQLFEVLGLRLDWKTLRFYLDTSLFQSQLDIGVR